MGNSCRKLAGSSREARCCFPQPLHFSSLPVSEPRANRLLLPTARSAKCEGVQRPAQAGAAPEGRRHWECMWGGRAAAGGSPKSEGLVGKPNSAHRLSHFPSALEMYSSVINLWPSTFTFFPLTPMSPAATGELCLRKSPFPSPKSPPGETAAPARLAGLDVVSNALDPVALHCLLSGISQGCATSFNNHRMSGVSVTLIISAVLLGMLN